MSGWGGRKVTALRQRMAQMLPVPCPVCGHMITDTTPWDIGHIVPRDVDPDLAWEPANWRLEHSRCNRRAGQRITARKRTRRRTPPPTSRDW